MTYPVPSSTDERRALEIALAHLRAEWGFAPSFGLVELLVRWERHVESVETGYRYSLFDYIQDLSLRDEIENVKDEVPLRLRNEIVATIQPVDRRFRFATLKAPQALGGTVCGGERFWWLRIPKRLEGQLLEDLIHQEILPGGT